MRKKITRYGTSHIVTLNAKDLEFYGLKKDDIIEFEPRKVLSISEEIKSPSVN